jgi:Secretion system C-terminal sorting domain
MLNKILYLIVLINLTAFSQTILDIQKFRIHPGTVTQTEPVATVNSQNSSLIFASDVTINVSDGFRSEGVYISTDGGFNWTGNDTCNGASIINHGGDPGVAITDSGRLILSHIGNLFPGMYSNYSDDMGITWSNNYTISSNSVEDKGALAIDNSSQSNYKNRLYRAYVDYVNISVQISISTDNGLSWSQPMQVNPSPPTRSTGSSIAIGNNGTVNICWAGVTSSTDSHEDYIGFAFSTNGGQNWSVAQNIIDINGIFGFLPEKSNIRVNSIPQIAIDNSGGSRNGWLYIVTTEKNHSPAGSDPDIILYHSEDGGNSWSQGIRVNQDPINDGKIQYFPFLDVDNFGDLNILFYDDRYTTSDSASVFLARSTDGGDSWNEYEINNSTFKPKPIPGAASGYQGDHIALLSNESQLNAFWMADYSGVYQVWTSVIDRNILGIKENRIDQPLSCDLYQNYPNPFNPTTTIEYNLSSSGFVSLKLYDVKGSLLTELVNEYQLSGKHRIKVSDRLSNGKNLSSGVYFYRLTTQNFTQTKSMILLK